MRWRVGGRGRSGESCSGAPLGPRLPVRDAGTAGNLKSSDPEGLRRAPGHPPGAARPPAAARRARWPPGAAGPAPPNPAAPARGPALGECRKPSPDRPRQRRRSGAVSVQLGRGGVRWGARPHTRLAKHSSCWPPTPGPAAPRVPPGSGARGCPASGVRATTRASCGRRVRGASLPLGSRPLVPYSVRRCSVEGSPRTRGLGRPSPASSRVARRWSRHAGGPLGPTARSPGRRYGRACVPGSAAPGRQRVRGSAGRAVPTRVRPAGRAEWAERRLQHHGQLVRAPRAAGSAPRTGAVMPLSPGRLGRRRCTSLPRAPWKVLLWDGAQEMLQARRRGPGPAASDNPPPNRDPGAPGRYSSSVRSARPRLSGAPTAPFSSRELPRPRADNPGRDSAAQDRLFPSSPGARRGERGGRLGRWTSLPGRLP